MTHVYLAGPILGCTQSEANDWRHYVSATLAPHGVTGVSPLRCEPIIGERYGNGGTDPCFGTARAIASKNYLDVQSCALTLAYMPKTARLSLGTLIELAWAHSLRKPTILVTDDPLLTDHPVVQACAGWVLRDLDSAIEVIVGVLSVYSKEVK